MINRLIYALAWVSLILAFAVFIISYANFPEEVLIYINQAGDPVMYLGRDALFYTGLLIAILFNGTWIASGGIIKKTSPSLKLTLTGIGVTQIAFNVFFASAVYFINLLNSRENLDYSNFGTIIMVTGTLLVMAMLFTVVARLIIKK